VCVVTGLRQYLMDLPQGGLEIPCCYTFKTIHDAEGEKARKIIEGLLSVEIIATTEFDVECNIGWILIQVPENYHQILMSRVLLPEKFQKAMNHPTKRKS